MRCILVLAMLVLGGCGSATPPATTFDLTVPAGRMLSSAGRSQIVVADPNALQPLNADRILVTSGSTLSALGGAQWSDQLPRLVQARLIETFENAGRAVARPGSGVSADYTLNTDLRRFSISAGPPAEAVVEISASLVSNQAGRIVAMRVFRHSVPVSDVSAQEGAPAIDEAAAIVMRDIVRWVTSRV